MKYLRCLYYTLPLFAIFLLATSCGDDDYDTPTYSITGSWDVVYRAVSLSSEKSQANATRIANGINSSYNGDAQQLNITTKFSEITAAVPRAAVTTTAIKEGSDIFEWRTSETYYIDKDSIRMSDTALKKDVAMSYHVKEQVFMTARPLDAEAIHALMLANGIYTEYPDDIKGVLTTKMVKKNE